LTSQAEDCGDSFAGAEILNGFQLIVVDLRSQGDGSSFFSLSNVAADPISRRNAQGECRM
jgi:hypothetical protein